MRSKDVAILIVLLVLVSTVARVLAVFPVGSGIGIISRSYLPARAAHFPRAPRHGDVKWRRPMATSNSEVLESVRSSVAESQLNREFAR